jgi:hypothetical protein
MYCPDCGERLECFAGEPYCPECTRYEVEELARQATAEAVQFRQAEAAAAQAALAEPADDALPF